MAPGLRRHGGKIASWTRTAAHRISLLLRRCCSRAPTGSAIISALMEVEAALATVRCSPWQPSASQPPARTDASRRSNHHVQAYVQPWGDSDGLVTVLSPESLD